MPVLCVSLPERFLLLQTFPIRILTPRKYRVKKLVNAPKYKACVLKVQLVVSLTGEIVFASFPHLGVDHDSTIWRTSLADGAMIFDDHEWILADPAYIGCDHCATK